MPGSRSLALVPILFLVSCDAAPPASLAQTISLVVDCDTDGDWQKTLFCFGRSGAQDYASPTAFSQYGNHLSARMLYSHDGGAFPVAGQARCVDGTEPMVWVDAAEGVDPHTVNDWVIALQGGGSCFGSGADFGNCADSWNTPGERWEMTSDSALAGPALRRTIQGGRRQAGGILAEGGVFAGFHRIKVHKCSYDRYLGDNDLPVPVEGEDELEVFHQGAQVLDDLFDQLSAGDWAYDDYSSEPEVARTLPAMCSDEADRIVVAGHSGGAHGLYFNLDRIRDQLVALGCDFRTPENPDGEDELIGILDANFTPMLTNECSFDPAGCDGGGGLYSGDVEASVGHTLQFSSAFFEAESSPYRVQLADYGRDSAASLNTACADAYPPEEEWRCRDRQHLLAEHLDDIPIFVRESLADSNPEHFPAGGHPVLWAEEGAWAPPGWDLADRPHMTLLADYANRVIDQSEQIATHHHDTGAASRLFYLPACRDHNGLLTGGFERMIIDVDSPDDDWEGLKLGEAMRNFVEDVSSGVDVHDVARSFPEDVTDCREPV